MLNNGISTQGNEMASVGNPLAFNESNAPNFGHSELYPLVAFVHWCTALGVATEKAVHRELVCGCCLEGDAGGRESAVFEGVQRCCRKQVFGLKKSRNCCSAEDLMERYLFWLHCLACLILCVLCMKHFGKAGSSGIGRTACRRTLAPHGFADVDAG